MKLIEEIVDYCLARGMLDETQLLRLQEMGLGCWVYYDYEDYCDDCEALWEKARVEADERLMEIEKLAQVGEEERVLMERVERHSNARMAARRKAGGGSRPVRKQTTAPELDALLAPLLDAMFADDLSRCVVKLGARAGIKETSNVRDAASSLARLSESELLTALTQALDANGRDRLSLNDVYAAILAWPDLTFLKERGGPAVDACRTLLREDYESGVASRDAWLLGESNAVRDLYWYQRFKLGLIAALRTVYETDKATFKRWSTDGGRLPFWGWEETKKVDATCWSVWAFEERTPREVSYAEWEATLERLNNPRTLALRLTLTDSLAFDFSHLTVVDGDNEQFKAAADAPTVARSSFFYTHLITRASDDLLPFYARNWDKLTLKNSIGVTDAGLSLFSGSARLQVLELTRLANVTDAGLSSLSGCANLQALRLNGLGRITDAGLSSLSGCANLQMLELSYLNRVTDAGLSSLSGCANLQTLRLQRLGGVTDAGLSSLSG
ncbi:MAG: hypothetical protein IJZ10_04840, partial [Thermoguttaceae bacterium]|nr:hypothetical protein [Thermoguttaceae bacterium]